MPATTAANLDAATALHQRHRYGRDGEQAEQSDQEQEQRQDHRAFSSKLPT